MSNRKHRLGDLCTVKHGFAFPGECFSSDPEYPVLVTPGNFAIGGGFQQTKVKTFSGDFSNEWVFRPGDLVVTMTDLSKAGDTLGFPARIPRGGAFLHNQRVGKVVITRPEELDIRFLEWVMCAPPYRRWILGTATGSAVKHTSPGRILDFEFVLPDLEHQQRVASILDSLSEMIAANKWVSDTLESIAQTLFRSWFVDFDPVRAKMRGEKPVGMDDATAALFPDSMEESELGDIPAGWNWTPLDEIAEFLNGLALQKFPKEPEDPGLPAIKIAQLRAGNTQGADRVSSHIDSRFIVRDGDILFSWSGTLEVEVWAGGDGALNQHLFKVSGQGYPDWFAYFSTRVFLPEFRQIASSKATTMGHIQRKHLTESMVAVPGSGLLQVADELIRPLFELKLNRIFEAKRLSNIRDSLLPRLISGELQIPDDLVA